ncbi:hypothetical protein DL93DRAFT_1066118 [Clavulina sp. PMI_390]|nr:hypothetical protein DL93DRAFT_1066118 [Clavulina sp. PMI_390]
MKPWVLSSTYRFASPSVIDAIKIAPPLLPIIVPVIFGYKCGTSARRVKKHLEGKKPHRKPITVYELPDPITPAPDLIQSDDSILSKAPEVREALAYMFDSSTNECFSSPTCHEYLNTTPLPVISTDSTPILSTPWADAAMSVNKIIPSNCTDSSLPSLPQFTTAISQTPESLDPASLTRSPSCSSTDSDFPSTLRKKLKFTPSLPSNPLKAVLKNSEKQEQMIKSIRDALGDKLRIHLAFLPGVWNSHAVIVCQFPDRKGLEYHEQGRRVIEHWAEHFEFFGRGLQ